MIERLIEIGKYCGMEMSVEDTGVWESQDSQPQYRFL
jgi:hypothetical protein